ncbi:MAG: GTPase (G3E family) [Oscillospiraceae bacterium]|nr:GTPase (G3E family) [Oscillospiraceae bacterium]
MIKVDLVTGFLGAGKTTFLLRYARYLMGQGLRIGILVYDHGAMNVDLPLLNELRGEKCELETLAGGCDADCHRRRFRTKLIAMAMSGYDRVVIDPSGVFDMDEFFDILHEPPVDSWFEIGSILTILNAETEALLTDEMEYLLASEAACAGKLLLSKLPDKNPEQRASEILKHLNQALSDIRCGRSFTETDLFCKDWSKLDAADFEILANAGYRNASYIKKYQTDMLRSTVHYFLHIHLPESEIEPVIREIMEDSECGTIYRIKGTLPAADGTFLSVNAEKNRITLSPTVIGQAVLIVIGETLNREQIDTHLKAKNTDPEYVSI